MKLISTFLTSALFTVIFTLGFSASATAGEQTYEEQVQEMYIAYYSRPGDPAGVAYWAGKLEQSGGDLNEIIDQFGNSLEYKERFQFMNEEKLVNNIFLNLFGRDADSAGLDFYVQKLINGEATLASIALSIAKGVVDGTSDADIVNNKIEVAIAYSNGIASSGATYGEDQIADAILLISSLDSEEATLATVLTIVAEAFTTESEVDITALITSAISDASTEGSANEETGTTETETPAATPAAEEETNEEVAETPAAEEATEEVAETPAAEEATEEEVAETPAAEEETPAEEVALKSITINWSIPSARENGDDLFPYEIGGYEILYKKVNDALYTSEIVNDSQTVSLDIDGLSPGNYEIKIASFDTDNLLSDYQSVTITII